MKKFIKLVVENIIECVVQLVCYHSIYTSNVLQNGFSIMGCVAECFGISREYLIEYFMDHISSHALYYRITLAARPVCLVKCHVAVEFTVDRSLVSFTNKCNHIMLCHRLYYGLFFPSEF